MITRTRTYYCCCLLTVLPQYYVRVNHLHLNVAPRKDARQSADRARRSHLESFAVPSSQSRGKRRTYEREQHGFHHIPHLRLPPQFTEGARFPQLVHYGSLVGTSDKEARDGIDACN